MNNSNMVLAMYDVRGIQKYIFNTPLLKNAMGASALVDNIIEKALEIAVKDEGIQDAELQWCNESVPLPFNIHPNVSLQVLYIGGGNAYVLFNSRDMCIRINKRMSKFILENTYSLQLAAAITDFTGSYRKDYDALFRNMNQYKASMVETKPLGALPVMLAEIDTGYPVVQDGKSRETLFKEENKSKNIKEDNKEKILDSLVSKKGEDSTIAVVHMDGNNMGMRIRSLIEGIDSYEDGIALMRLISFNISHQYRNAFEKMKIEFESKSGKDKKVIRKIIVAGDDITYVCNASIALESVEFFCNEISKHTMIEKQGEKPGEQELQEYNFSVCGGVAFMNSHFPFSIAYDVAEACCKCAKTEAKRNKSGDRVGNFVDFQLCRDIRCRDLEKTRLREYITPDGMNLMMRPYYIETPQDREIGAKLKNKDAKYEELIKKIEFFADTNNLPRSFSKKLRNTYPLGISQVDMLATFLNSRGWHLPGKTDEEKVYVKETLWNLEDKKAVYFDALELLDIMFTPSEQNSNSESAELKESAQ